MNRKKAIVLLHGLGEDASIWNGFVPFLQKEYRCIVPDYANFTGMHSMDDYAEYIYDLVIETKEIDSCCLIGHSMGGYIALAFAERYPEVVTGLVLFHSTAYPDSEERKETRMKHIEFLESHGLNLFLRNFIPNLFTNQFVEAYPEIIDKQRKDAQRIDVGGFISAIRAMRNRPNRLDILKKATYPVGYIIGKEDKAIPLEDVTAQVEALSNPMVLVLDKVGHSGMVEAPDECLAFLRTFLRTI